jgi:flagellar protein FliS
MNAPVRIPNQAALARYASVKVTTASPGQVLVMLYDGVLRFLREARTAIVDKNQPRAGERIGRALKILEHLLGSLDPQHAPKLCEMLQGLYMFCMRHLVRANIEKSTDKIDDVVRMLSPLRDAWSTAVAQVASTAEGR